MGLLRATLAQARIWNSYLKLASPDDSERKKAMETLREAGNPALPCLRYATTGYNTPRTQFAASIVLHQLGDPQGLRTLKEALLWKLPDAPDLGPEMESAFIAIGSPDAVTMLLGIWEQNTDWHDSSLILQCICHVFASLRDPRALEALTQRAIHIPELFEQTVPAFGEMAVLHLERMARSPETACRCLAIQTLRHIPRHSAFRVLAPLLRDPSPQVRALVPEALVMTGGETNAARAIQEALRTEFSTPEALETLARLNMLPADILLAMTARWNPQTLTPPGDTGGAILTAIPLLASSALPSAQVMPVLCDLLERKPGPALTAAAARAIAVRGQSGSELDSRARATLIRLLTHPDGQTREEAAASLLVLGDTFGRQFNQLLAFCRPQGNLLRMFQTILRGGPDAGQAANQAVQQVSQWVARVSKEAAERLATSAQERSDSADHSDSRMVPLLEELLTNTLDRLQRATDPGENEELVTLSVTVTRALARVGMPQAHSAQEALVRALRTVKRSAISESNAASSFAKSEVREIGGLARAAAAEALQTLYGSHCFPLFLEALYYPASEVRGTAVSALGALGDPRALLHLQPIAADAAHLHQAAAQEAIACIKRIHPEMMTLLRASSGVEMQPDTLLRPASSPGETRPEHLLRPSPPTNEPAG
jgi:HEAT repeat protein